MVDKRLHPEQIWPRKVKKKNDPMGQGKVITQLNQNKIFFN